MAPTWTYPITDLLTGQLMHDDLPVRCDYFSDFIGVAEGEIKFSLPIDGRVKLDYDSLTQPWQRVIWPSKNGQPFGCYVIVAEAPYSRKAGELQFSGRRIDHIFTRRNIWSTLVFRQVDQLTIFRNLQAYALGLTPLNVNANDLALVTLLPANFRIPWFLIDTSTLSGVPRDRLDTTDGYQSTGNKKIADVLEDLTQLEDGFEHRLQYNRHPDTGQLTATSVLGYPQLAGDSPDFELPGNVTDFQYARDGSPQVTAARAFGAGTGPEKLSSPPVYSTLDPGAPGLAGSTTSTATNANTLLASARAIVAADERINTGLTLELDSTTLGDYQLGATPLARIADPRWPSGLRRRVRIIGHRVEPARPGRSERVTPSVLQVD